jgi:hypothetical protein
MAQTNFTAGDMYPKAAPAPAPAPKKAEAPAPAPKKAVKKPEPVVEAPVVEEAEEVTPEEEAAE